jgi:hypothetical protein
MGAVVPDPIRVFVGVSANDEDLEFASVLHYSLEKYASEPLDIHWMRLSRNPKSFWYSDPQKGRGWCTRQWATPFSALRWGVPAFCNYEGKAIYLDIDMILMDDIAKLWNQDTNGKPMLSRHEAICVAMYDNAKMRQALPPIEVIKTKPGLYREIRRNFSAPHMVQRYNGGNWNCLDGRRENGEPYASVSDPDIKIMHYTDIPTQPHLRYAIPRLHKEGKRHWYDKGQPHQHPRQDAVKLFDELLVEAIDAGYALDNYRNPTPFGNYGR